MISVTVLAKNSAKTLGKVLDSLKPFDEVLVYDTGSTDGTLELAKSYPNVRVVSGPFEGFGKTHNKASALAHHDWIFSVDSDEVVDEELLRTLKSLSLDPKSVYRVRRKNFYKGVWIWSCGWYPDAVVRLYNRKSTEFSQDDVHERVLAEGMEIAELQGHLLHTPFFGSEDFLRKMQHYSTLFAEQNAGKKEASFPKALFRGAYTFFKTYFIKRGALQGSRGFEISFYNAATAYYKYLKLSERILR